MAESNLSEGSFSVRNLAVVMVIVKVMVMVIVIAIFKLTAIRIVTARIVLIIEMIRGDGNSNSTVTSPYKTVQYSTALPDTVPQCTSL